MLSSVLDWINFFSVTNTSYVICFVFLTTWLEKNEDKIFEFEQELKCLKFYSPDELSHCAPGA